MPHGEIVDVTTEERALVSIDAQISELNTTLQKALGFDWTTEDSSSVFLTYAEDEIDFDGSVADFLKLENLEERTFLFLG